MTRAALLLCAVSLSACSYANPGNPGNPGNTPYAGQPGSVFDASAGPLRPVQPEPSYEMPPAAPMAGQQIAPGTPLPPVSQVPGTPPR